VASYQELEVEPLQIGERVAIGGDNKIISLRSSANLEHFIALVNQLS